jgi:phosphonoacetate hydrolase
LAIFAHRSAGVGPLVSPGNGRRRRGVRAFGASEYAGKATLKENGIENVGKLVGRSMPDRYSVDLSLFALDAGVKLLSTVRPDLMYLSTSDYVQHKHAPGESEADAYHHAVDNIVASLIALGATVAITAGHGMADKSTSDGTPNVIYLEGR